MVAKVKVIVVSVLPAVVNKNIPNLPSFHRGGRFSRKVTTMKDEILKHKLNNNTSINYWPFRGTYNVTDRNNKIITSGHINKKTNTQELTGRLNIPLSTICNLQCKYCVENYNSNKQITINGDFALQSVTSFIKYIKSKDIHNVQLSFDYGGEPLCKPLLFEKICNSFKNLCETNNLKYTIQVTTNAAYGEKEINTLLKHSTEVIVSLDGYKELHNINRISRDGTGTFKIVFENAKKIFTSNKLKHFCIVVTDDTIKNYKQTVDFFAKNFPGCSIKLNPIRIEGRATSDNFSKIKIQTWNPFIDNIIKYCSQKGINLTKNIRTVNNTYFYGCEHLKVPNWFCFFDGKISCCHDKDQKEFIFASYTNNNLDVDNNKLCWITSNSVKNISICSTCIAKYHCAGGCPVHRMKNNINCTKRINRFVKLLINK